MMLLIVLGVLVLVVVGAGVYLFVRSDASHTDA